MGKEIERKFLLRGDAWKRLAEGALCRQGYLNSAKERIVRIRTVGDKAFLTVKGLAAGSVRAEYEYEIPLADGTAMLEILVEKPLIEKKRYAIKQDDLIWEVDEFFGENAGLVVAEVELDYEEQQFAKPEWVGEEVTGDPRYYNSNLMKCPYGKWKNAGEHTKPQ